MNTNPTPRIRKRRLGIGGVIGLFVRTLIFPLGRYFWTGTDDQVLDADGRVRTLVLRARSKDERPLLAEVQRRLPDGPADPARGAAMFFGLIACLILIWTVATLLRRGRIPLSNIPGAILCPIIAIWSYQRRRTPRFNGRSPEVISKAWLRAGHCPSCAYPLPKTIEAPARVICTECGAAWNVP